jgi:hypothetical protein
MARWVGDGARLPRRIKRQLDEIGADMCILDNRFSPFCVGDDEFVWVLCFGCGLPFQYWGTLMIGFREQGDGSEPAAVKIAAGPCPRCNGVGAPLRLYEFSRDGITVHLDHSHSIGLQQRRLDELFSLLMVPIPENMVQAVDDLMRTPGLKWLGSWLHENQGVIGAAALGAAVISILLTVTEAERQHQQLPGVEIHINDDQIDRIVEELTEHFDMYHPPGSRYGAHGAGPHYRKSTVKYDREVIMVTVPLDEQSPNG